MVATWHWEPQAARVDRAIASYVMLPSKSVLYYRKSEEQIQLNDHTAG
jgi:hypothetical protein